MKYYLSRADPSVRARAWAGVVLLPIAHVPRRLYVAPLDSVLDRRVAVHADLLLLEALGEVVLGIARLARVRAINFQQSILPTHDLQIDATRQV